MLMTLRDIYVRFTEDPVLDHASLTIDEGERICLVGRNGAGKSTLLRVIDGSLTPEEGDIEHAPTLRVHSLPQDVPPDISGRVFEVVARGLGNAGDRLLAYRRELESGASRDHLLSLQYEMEASGGWQQKVAVDSTISRMDLDPDAEFRELSGGMQRRALLARALAGEPDILLLDEPTNHLDIAGVEWLENFLRSAPWALVFITHDRAFLDRVATRIVEVDRGKLLSWPGDFAAFQRRKAEALAAEHRANAEFDKQLAEEEAWLRRGVKARGTRNMGRVRNLERMREEAARRRTYQGRASLSAQHGEATGKRVIDARQLTVSIGGQTIVRDLNLKIRREQTLCVMGPNGCGKTTLLRALLGEIPPDSGHVIHGENLQVGYFDQNRRQLRPDKSAAWNVADGNDQIEYNGRNLHVFGYLRAFLFTPERARVESRLLSGGERNRLLLARLFARPSNVLVMDEPTNDLDMETLELLEDLVANFPGTVILVSHDRAFVNAVADAMLVHEGEERGFGYYVGNYDDWLRQRPAAEPARITARPDRTRASARKPRTQTKLSYKDQRELDQMPGKIETLEDEIQSLHQAMTEPGFFEQSPEAIRDTQEQLARLEEKHKDAMKRWEDLEQRKAELKANVSK
jgi:ATP-binding cassette subfamily F protein uup